LANTIRPSIRAMLDRFVFAKVLWRA
jgi:hypothetical protein